MLFDINLCKVQLSKLTQSRGFLGVLLTILTGRIREMVAQLAKNISLTLHLTAASSATDAAIQKNVSRFWIYDINNVKPRNE